MASLDPNSSAHRGPLRTRFDRNLDWFLALSRQEVGPPLSLHGRRVWTDADGAASRLGSRALSREFTQWLGRSEQHWPLRRAIASFHGAPVRQGLPRVDATLATLAATGGNLERAVDILAHRHPVMGDPRTALAHFTDALGRLHAQWTKDARRRLLAAERAA